MSLALSVFSFQKTPRFLPDKLSSCRADNCEGRIPRFRLRKALFGSEELENVVGRLRRFFGPITLLL